LPRFTHMTPPLPQPPYQRIHSHIFGPIQLLHCNPLLSLVTWGVISLWKSVIDHHLAPIPNHKPIKQRSLIRCRTQKHPHTLHLPRHYISWCARYNLATNATCPPILGWVSIIVTQGENTLDYIITRAILLGISIGNPKLLQRDSPRVELVTNLRGWGFYYIDYPKCMLLFGVML
jgi:hypothetical protein